jgi:hypothetical protein
VNEAVGVTGCGAVALRSACQYRWVPVLLASTTMPLCAVMLCLVDVTSFIVADATSRITGVPRPGAKTGSSIDAVLS